MSYVGDVIHVHMQHACRSNRQQSNEVEVKPNHDIIYPQRSENVSKPLL